MEKNSNSHVVTNNYLFMNDKNIQNLIESKQKELDETLKQIQKLRKDLQEENVNAVKLDASITTLKTLLE